MEINAALRYGSQLLGEAGVACAGLEAKILLSRAMGRSFEYLVANSKQKLTNAEYEKFISLMERRINHEPIAYITGYKEFYGREFYVDNNVLIPRPDTETLIDATIELSKKFGIGSLEILELGTGSGCIIITLLLELAHATATASDISKQALRVAEQNSIKYSVEKRLKLVESDWFGNIAAQKFDIIISNPPYIPINQANLMAKETIMHEPHAALFAKQDGLEAYYQIAKYGKNFLKDNGLVILEIGFDQSEKVTDIFTNLGYELISSYKDLSSYVRVLCFKTHTQNRL